MIREFFRQFLEQLSYHHPCHTLARHSNPSVFGGLLEGAWPVGAGQFAASSEARRGGCSAADQRWTVQKSSKRRKQNDRACLDSIYGFNLHSRHENPLTLILDMEKPCLTPSRGGCGRDDSTRSFYSR
jgi:hypothetical protein